MTITLAIFYVAGAVTLGGALGVVMARNIIYAAFALLVALIGVAGLFLLAFAQFLALAQVLIYGGAIVIVILFTLMLTRIQDFRDLSDNSQWPIAALASASVFSVMVASVLLTDVRTTEAHEVGFEVLGETLFEQWAVPFEIASLVLLVTLIGAIVMVRDDRGLS